jgi:hypothetical protein
MNTHTARRANVSTHRNICRLTVSLWAIKKPEIEAPALSENENGLASTMPNLSFFPANEKPQKRAILGNVYNN